MIRFASLSMLLLNQSNLVKYMKLSSSLLGEATFKALMDSASVEFARKNAMRVVSCLSPETQFASGIQLENVSLYFSHGTDERGSEVVVELSEDKTLGAMVLMVVANGY